MISNNQPTYNLSVFKKLKKNSTENDELKNLLSCKNKILKHILVSKDFVL